MNPNYIAAKQLIKYETKLYKNDLPFKDKYYLFRYIIYDSLIQN